MRKVIMTSVLALSLMAAPSFAGSCHSGHASQAGQSSQSSQCEQADQGNHNHKPGFLQKVKESFKKGYEAGKKAGTKAHDAIQNKVNDSAVAAKKAITGKKNKTFVKGYYKADGTHVDGYWKDMPKHGKN